MKNKQSITVLLLGLSLMIVPCAEAKGKGGDKGKGKPATSDKAKPSKKPANKGKAKPNGGHDKKDRAKPGGGPDKKADKVLKDNKDWRKAAKFEDKDRKDVASYWDRYKGNKNGLPPGLAKNLRKGKSLPPGWDKKIRNGWLIEDDWWDMFDRVASADLPKGLKLPKDTGMFLYGDRMVRVHEPTREVVDFVKMPGVKL